MKGMSERNRKGFLGGRNERESERAGWEETGYSREVSNVMWTLEGNPQLSPLSLLL